MSSGFHMTFRLGSEVRLQVKPSSKVQFGRVEGELFLGSHPPNLEGGL